MENEKFIETIKTALLLLDKFQKTTDKSERRILRDIIRAIVKELTRV